MRYTPNGAAVCTFSIATNRSYVVEGERKEDTDFHRAVAWNKLAEVCNQLLKKGNRVFISGRLQNRSWEGQDGQQRQTTEIVIEDMILLTPKVGFSATDDLTDDAAAQVSDKSSSKSSTDDIKPQLTSPKAKEDKEATAQAPKEDPGDLDDLPF